VPNDKSHCCDGVSTMDACSSGTPGGGMRAKLDKGSPIALSAKDFHEEEHRWIQAPRAEQSRAKTHGSRTALTEDTFWRGAPENARPCV